MFPVQSNAIAKALLTDDMSGKQDVLQFGEEEQAEQLLQILYSDEIRSRIVDKYNLMQHYRIDPNDKYKNTRLYEMYSDNISFKRTEFMSVKIEVLDEKPEIASAIANDIASLLDSTKTRMQRDRANQAFEIVATEYNRKKEEVELMTDSIKALNRLGIYDYESQSEVTSEQYAIALSKGDERAIKRLGDQLKIIGQYGSAYMSVRENLYIQREQLNLLKKKYEEARIDAEAVLTYKFIVNKAFPAERKSYPVRWLIVVVSTLASLVFGILLLIVFDNIRRILKPGSFAASASRHESGPTQIIERVVYKEVRVEESKEEKPEPKKIIREEVKYVETPESRPKPIQHALKKTYRSIQEPVMASINSMEIFQIVVRRKMQLAAMVLVAIILGFIFSGETFIKPKYKSTAILYPVNIIPYSVESQTEQLLQLFHSADVRKMMIERFHLAKHYKVDSKNASNSTKLAMMYEENIVVRKTEFESIKLDITDENPDTACAMAFGIINCVDLKARALQREKTTEYVKILRNQLNEKRHTIDSLEFLNDVLRTRYGLLDYNSQSKEATKSFLKLVSDGASVQRIAEVDSLIRNLEEKGGAQISLTNQLKGLQKSYNKLKEEYDVALNDLTKELTYSNVVTKPFPADSKCYPIRSLIVLICALTAFLLGLLLFVIIDRRLPKSNAGAANK